MAKLLDPELSSIYETAADWRNSVMRNGESLLWPGDSVWTRNNLEAFKKAFTDPLTDRMTRTLRPNIGIS